MDCDVTRSRRLKWSIHIPLCPFKQSSRVAHESGEMQEVMSAATSTVMESMSVLCTSLSGPDRGTCAADYRREGVPTIGWTASALQSKIASICAPAAATCTSMSDDQCRPRSAARTPRTLDTTRTLASITSTSRRMIRCLCGTLGSSSCSSSSVECSRD